MSVWFDELEILGELDDSSAGRALAELLPIEGAPIRWGGVEVGTFGERDALHDGRDVSHLRIEKRTSLN